MSIYISLPTLEDTETAETIVEAVAYADYPSEVFINVACFSSKKYYISLLEKVGEFTNVKVTRYDFDKNRGVGRGRKIAMEEYSGQDYVLQIDSHTKFERGWDSILVEMHEKACISTGSQKTILTAYLGRFTSTAEYGRTRLDEKPLFPAFFPGYLENTGNTIPLWKSASTVNECPLDFPKDEFLPCPKFNANFAFGNKEFAKDTGLYEKSVFFEEEILQTINLLSSGFSLVFPNQRVPLSHLYSDDISDKSLGQRTSMNTGSKKSPNEHYKSMSNNYTAFVKDPKNKEACQIFQKYTGVHPIFGAVKPWRIPSNFTSKML